MTKKSNVENITGFEAENKPNEAETAATPIAKPSAFSLDKFKSKRGAALANVETAHLAGQFNFHVPTSATPGICRSPLQIWRARHPRLVVP